MIRMNPAHDTTNPPGSVGVDLDSDEPLQCPVKGPDEEPCESCQ